MPATADHRGHNPAHSHAHSHAHTHIHRQSYVTGPATIKQLSAKITDFFVIDLSYLYNYLYNHNKMFITTAELNGLSSAAYRIGILGFEWEKNSDISTQCNLHSHTHFRIRRCYFTDSIMPSLTPLDYLAHCLRSSVSSVEWSPTNCSTYTCNSTNCLHQQLSTLGKDTHIHTHVQTRVHSYAHTLTLTH